MSQKAKKAKNFGKVLFPNNQFSRRQLRTEKGWEVEGYAEHVLRSGWDLSMFIKGQVNHDLSDVWMEEY